jgi:hypothetical protein
MKYGILLNNTFNIGDDLQSVASSHFLPSIDYYPFKEQLSSFRSENHEKVKVIMNSWYMWRPDHMPASDDIDPLLISMCFARQCRDKLLTKETKSWLIKYGPVGCRDNDTKDWLISNDVPAYFSGCLTLTLNENKNLRQNNDWGGYILCVDVSEDVVNAIKKRTDRPVFTLSKWIFSNFYAIDKIEISKIYLYMFHQAAAVVTGNMHTSLPSLAINTPVCLLSSENNVSANRGNQFNANNRFDGLLDFFHHFDTDEFLSDPTVYDFNNPPQNPMTHLNCRNDLISRCKSFTGFYDESPTLSDSFNPSFELLKMLQFSKWTSETDYKGLVSIPNKRKILSTAIKRFMGKDKHDLIHY